jgi:hypothetical protein
MAINPNARYLVTQTEADLPESSILTPVKGLADLISSGNITLTLDGNLEQVCNLATTGIVVLSDVGATVTAATKTLSSSGTISITNPQGIAGNFKIDAIDNTSVQKIRASKGAGEPVMAAPLLNFSDTANVKIVVTDNPGNDWIDIDVDARLSAGINSITSSTNVNIADTMEVIAESVEQIGQLSIDFNLENAEPLEGLIYNGTKVVFGELEKSVYTLFWEKDPNLAAIDFVATPTTSVVGSSQVVDIGFNPGDAVTGDILGYYLNDDPLDEKNLTLQFITPELSDVSSVGLDIIPASSGVLEQTTPPITDTGTFELDLKVSQIATHAQVIRRNGSNEYVYDTFVYDLSVVADADSPVLNIVEDTMTVTPSVTVGFNVVAGDDNKILAVNSSGEWVWTNSGVGTVDSITFEPLATETSLAFTTASSEPMPLTASDTVILDFNVDTGPTTPTLAGSCIYYDGTDVRLGVPSTYSGKNTILFASQMTFPAGQNSMTVFFNGPNTNLNSLIAFAKGLSVTYAPSLKTAVSGNLSVELIAASGGYNVNIASDDVNDAEKSFIVVVYYLYP